MERIKIFYKKDLPHNIRIKVEQSEKQCLLNDRKKKIGLIYRMPDKDKIELLLEGKIDKANFLLISGKCPDIVMYFFYRDVKPGEQFGVIV